MIYIQILLVDNTNHPRRIFSEQVYPSGYKLIQKAWANQAANKRDGAEVVNGWYVKRFTAWTEYTRYITEAQAERIIGRQQLRSLTLQEDTGWHDEGGNYDYSFDV